MDTAVKAPAEAELHLLTSWGDPAGKPRRRRAAALSIAAHVVAVALLAVAPKEFFQGPPRPLPEEPRIVTPLVAPLAELTQPEPNKGPINKEFSMQAVQPRPQVRIPAGAPFSPGPRTPQPASIPAAPAPPAAPIPEPPKLETAAGPAPQLPPPQIEPVERPKLAFETPTARPTVEPGAGIPLPKASAAEALRGAIRSGSGSGSGGFGAGVDMPASPGVAPNEMQLLSDPMGVDFRPYLNRVLAAVKRYWLIIWPESARMGRSGRVAIQFSIDRRGTVPKLVIASGSGVQSLDRAAVAAVSGAVPFPELPREFKGDVIKIQLNFAYNVK